MSDNKDDQIHEVMTQVIKSLDEGIDEVKKQSFNFNEKDVEKQERIKESMSNIADKYHDLVGILNAMERNNKSIEKIPEYRQLLEDVGDKINQFVDSLGLESYKVNY